MTETRAIIATSKLQFEGELMAIWPTLQVNDCWRLRKQVVTQNWQVNTKLS